MDVTTYWLGLGVLIGLAAANYRGYSMLGGAIGGALLGPLAVLMFFVSSISGRDRPLVECPACKERIKSGATRCRYCHQDLPA